MYKRFLTCLSASLFVSNTMAMAQLGTPNASTSSNSITSSLMLQSSGSDSSSGTGVNANLPTGSNTPYNGINGIGLQNSANPQLLRGNTSTQTNSQIQQPNCVPTPIFAHTDFEQLVAEETSHPLPVFGRSLFSCLTTTYAPMDHIPVPADYVIGPNDEIDIQLWGSINVQQNLIVDRNGQIAMPEVGVLNVAGLHYSQLNDFLRTAVGRIYKNFKLNASLGQLRAIQVYVFGNVNQPGVYTVSSLSTLVNAIFAAGGPSATGSMRHIELRREGQTIADFDLYDLAVFGDKSHDIKLLPGDVIFVPPVGDQIALIGNLTQSAIFELRGKTSLAEAVHYAGGMTAMASTDTVLLEHIANHRRQVEQLALDGESMQRTLAGGDVVRVFPISPEIHETVTLRGNVDTPRRYAWHEGMRISDLISNREMLITRRYWHEANQSPEKGSNSLKFDPWNPDTAANPFLNPDGSNNGILPPGSATVPAFGGGQPQNLQPGGNANGLTTANGVPSNGSAANASTQNASGINSYALSGPPSYASSQMSAQANPAQTNAAQYPWRTNLQGTTGMPGIDPNSQPNFSNPWQMNLLDDLQKQDAEINWDYAVIERLDKRDLTTHLIPFHLGNALDDKGSADNQQLFSGDVVIIFGRKDIAIPMEKHVVMVQVAGEVNAPGIYRVKPGDTLADVLRQAGGITKNAYIFGLLLNRISTRQIQQEQLNVSIDQMRRDLIANYTNSAAMRSSLTVSPKDGTDVLLTSEQGLLDQLSTLQPTGRVVLKLKRDAKHIEDVPKFALEDGDSIIVPSRPNTVQVVGAVYNQTAFRYVPGKTVDEYLRDAGGGSRNADTGHMYLLEADGSLINNHGSMFSGGLGHSTLMPGDAIVVPLHFRSQNPFWQSLAPITSVLAQTAVTGALVANSIP
jgi:polysaccharide biosynthesis/export protein